MQTFNAGEHQQGWGRPERVSIIPSTDPQPTRSAWEEPAAVDRLVYEGTRHVHVAVVGAGITGLTAAALLAQAGKSVVVLEAGEFGQHGTTHRTSAHLTAAPDEQLSTLVRRFGLAATQTTIAALVASIDQIQRLDQSSGGHACFRRVSAWRYSESGTKEETDSIREDCDLARDLGFQVELEPSAPLPFPTSLACRFANQAAFHPVRYLNALAQFVAAQPGCDVFHHSAVRAYEDGNPCTVSTDRGTLSCDNLVLATHSPIGLWLTLHPRLLASMSYCVAVRTERATPDALFWDCDTPYHYIRRTQPDDPMGIVVGGEDHRTGAATDTESHAANLERYVRDRFGIQQVHCRWSAQFFDPADGLPYIGRGAGAKRIYVATGYSGVGLTFGTAAAMLIADLILEVDNPWAEVVKPTRIKPLASAANTLHEVATTAQGLVGERLRHLESIDDVDIQPGQGKVLRMDGRPVAVHRDHSGNLHVHSAVCPHMGCVVAWNSAERCWNCPCHGSLFAADGAMLAGPAVANLKELPLPVSAATR